MALAKFAPHVPMGPLDFYQERLREVGRLAAALDDTDESPLDVILRFFEIDEIDRPIVVEAYQSSAERLNDDKKIVDIIDVIDTLR